MTGAFDIIHPGYIKLFQFAKQHCDYLVVALHVDPSTEHPEKPKPVLSVIERMEILKAIRYVDEVVPYVSEDVLVKLLEVLKPDVRFLGDDYMDKPITGVGIAPIMFHKRETGWSTTKFKQEIAKSLEKA